MLGIAFNRLLAASCLTVLHLRCLRSVSLSVPLSAYLSASLSLSLSSSLSLSLSPPSLPPSSCLAKCARRSRRQPKSRKRKTRQLSRSRKTAPAMSMRRQKTKRQGSEVDRFFKTQPYYVLPGIKPGISSVMGNLQEESDRAKDATDASQKAERASFSSLLLGVPGVSRPAPLLPFLALPH